jgi:hypothetical protein
MRMQTEDDELTPERMKEAMKAVKEHDKEHIKKFTESFINNVQALVTVGESHKEGDVTVIDKIDFTHVSLVQSPPNKHCRFEVYKSDEDGK